MSRLYACMATVLYDYTSKGIAASDAAQSYISTELCRQHDDITKGIYIFARWRYDLYTTVSINLKPRFRAV